ncbi:MAG TPA: hypothetical protein VMT52_18825 [Planctomycetota bacterium]|nr:hypothetical protein [Planctomycetota bacterium]
MEIRRTVGRPGLAAGEPLQAAPLDELLRLSDEDLLGGAVDDRNMAGAVRAGLLLLADRMDESHELSQGIKTPEGSYWHGILHRREPDYSNAKHWFRHVGDHPVFVELARAPSESSGEAGPALREAARNGKWDPFRFIDLCEECVTGARPLLREELEAIQEREMDLLLAFCTRRAAGRNTFDRSGGAP